MEYVEQICLQLNDNKCILTGGLLDACNLLLLLVFPTLEEHTFLNIMKATVHLFMAGYRLTSQGEDLGHWRKCLWSFLCSSEYPASPVVRFFDS